MASNNDVSIRHINWLDRRYLLSTADRVPFLLSTSVSHRILNSTAEHPNIIIKHSTLRKHKFCIGDKDETEQNRNEPNEYHRREFKRPAT